MNLPIAKLSLCIVAALSCTAEAQVSEYEAAQEFFNAAAEKSRQNFSQMSFEQFKETVFHETGENGRYFVNGDTPILDEKHLREFYDNNVRAKPVAPETESPEFAINKVGGLMTLWSDLQKRALTYCVSESLGDRYEKVVADMNSAARAWEAVADIDFIHVAREDNQCTDSNPNVLFNVRFGQLDRGYMAVAFFPNYPRSTRILVIAEPSFDLDQGGNLQLTGVLRHELGHTLGARHEHTRPEAGACFRDDDWEPVTNYDAFSVMHYPQCNGKGDWSLTLTNRDKNGVACVYGPADDFVVDTKVCRGLNVPPVKQLQFDEEHVAMNGEVRYDDLQVRPNSRFIATIEGVGSDPGDPDLYVRFNGTPQVDFEYDCRPYMTGADERCYLDVPPKAKIARVMVHGRTKGRYKLIIKFQEPDESLQSGEVKL